MREIEVPINTHVNADERLRELDVPAGRIYRFSVEDEPKTPEDLGMGDHIDFHEIPDHTELVIPPGRYTTSCHFSSFTDEYEWTSVSNVIVRAEDPDNPPVLEHEEGAAGMVFMWESGENFLMKDIEFHQQQHYRWGDVAFRSKLEDGYKLENITVSGWSGVKDNGGNWTFYSSVTSPSGQAQTHNCRKVGPSQFAGHGESAGAGGMWGDHEGAQWFTQCDIRNQGGDGGLYTGKHPGTTNFYRCFFKNNDMGEIRMGAGSWIVDSITVRDWDTAHPDNEIVNEPSGVNGIYFSSAEHGKSGGGVIGCDVLLRSTYSDRPNTVAGININNSDGIDRIEDCRIRHDLERGRPIRLGNTEKRRLDNHEFPDNQTVTVRDVHISGDGPWRGEAIHAKNRHGSTFEGIVIDDAREGTDVWDFACSNGHGVEGCFETVDVTHGDPDAPRVDPARILDDPLPEADLPPTDGGSDPTEEPDDAEQNWHTVTFALPADASVERVHYDFRADDAVRAPEDGGQGDSEELHPDDGGAFGTLEPGESHTWEFDFEVTNVSMLGGEATVSIDGETRPRSEFATMDTPSWTVEGEDWPFEPPFSEADVGDGGGDDSGGSDGGETPPDQSDPGPEQPTVTWSASLGGDVEGAALTRPNAYLGTKTGGLRCFSRAGDEQWSAMFGDSVEGVAAFGDGSVLGASVDGTVRRLEADGTERWRTDADVGALSSGTVTTTDDVVVCSASGDMVCLDGAGDVQWTTEAHDGDTEGVAVASDGTILSAGDDRSLAAHSMDGDELWRWDAPDQLEDVSLFPDGEAALIASDDGSLRRLVLADQTIDWEVSLDRAIETCLATPEWAIAGGTDRLAVFDHSGGDVWSVDTGAQVDSLAADPAGLLVGTDDGQVRFFALDGELPEPDPEPTPPEETPDGGGESGGSGDEEPAPEPEPEPPAVEFPVGGTLAIPVTVGAVSVDVDVEVRVLEDGTVELVSVD